MENPAFDRAQARAASISGTIPAAATAPVLTLPLRRDALEVTADAVVVWRLRWGLRLRHRFAAAEVLSLGYRRSRFLRSAALLLDCRSGRRFRFSFGLRPYEAEQLFGELRRSGLWIANRLESPQHDVFVTSPSAP